MKSYCLKCRKNTENINPRVSMVGQWYYQNVQYAVVKNEDLLKPRSKRTIEQFRC